MKLRKIYSSDKRFNTITFNSEFNVILGEVTDVNNLSQDSHNLGKSTLINLIDFMLLKEIDKDFFLKKDIFSQHVFYMTIENNFGKFITIKRGVKNNTKISLKIHADENLDCRIITDWEYEDLPLGSKDNDKNPKYILNFLLGFDVLKTESYRKTAGYFLRTQEDYNDVFKLQKYKGKDVDWKPVLFELLGFNNEHMINKYNIETEVSIKEKLIDDVKKEFKVDAGERDRIKGLIEILEAKRDEIVKWLDQFDFYQKEVGLNKEAIDNVERKIAKLNTERYNLDFEIKQIEESLKVKVDYNIDDVLEIYKQVGIYFPDQLVKSYEELIAFNKNISNERMKYLKESQKHKTIKLQDIDKQLIELNEKRVNYLSVLKGSNTFDKYNTYRNDLIEIEREIERSLTELDNIDNVKNIQKEIDKLKNNLNDEVEKLEQQIDESTDVYKHIRKDFHDFVYEVLDNNAMISIELNGNQNVDFKAAFYSMENQETAQGMGHTYRKLLCACFDLAVVKNYMNKSFYRFIYHDGCLESLDPRKQRKYLDLVRRISKENNIQYILTCLSSDIPDEDKYKIKENEISVKLSDQIDNTKRLFGFSF